MERPQNRPLKTDDLYFAARLPITCRLRNLPTVVLPEIVPTLYSYIPRLAVALGCVVRMPGEDRIYLTFDDGPDPESTPQILDVLREHQAMASFFLIGEKAEKHPEIVGDILAEGHTVGQHGYKHLNAWRHTSSTILEDLDTANRTIQDITGAFPS